MDSEAFLDLNRQTIAGLGETRWLELIALSRASIWDETILSQPDVGDQLLSIEGWLQRTTDERLSLDFRLREFHSKDATPIPGRCLRAVVRLVLGQLQPMRDKFGECVVHSAYRTASENENVHGAARSTHRYDLDPRTAAADVEFARGSPSDWAEEADRLLGESGGVAIYPGTAFVHIDNRATKWRSLTPEP